MAMKFIPIALVKKKIKKSPNHEKSKIMLKNPRSSREMAPTTTSINLTETSLRRHNKKRTLGRRLYREQQQQQHEGSTNPVKDKGQVLTTTYGSRHTYIH